MLKKLAILQAMARLPVFTTADLAREAGANEATVRTVMARSPTDWFREEPPVGAATRGGQAKRASLTELGATAIAKLLEDARGPKADDEDDEPLGLQTARLALSRLPDLAGEDRALALSDIKANLAWAREDLNDSEFANKDRLRILINAAKGEYYEAVEQGRPPVAEPAMTMRRLLRGGADRKPPAQRPPARSGASWANYAKLIWQFKNLSGLIVSYPSADTASAARARTAVSELKAFYEIGLEQDGSKFFEEITLESIDRFGVSPRFKTPPIVLVFFDSESAAASTVKQIVRVTAQTERAIVFDAHSKDELKRKLSATKPVMYAPDFVYASRRVAEALREIAE